MSSVAPHSGLEHSRTQKGATGQSIVHCFCLYFETRGDSELSLTGSSIAFTALMGALAQLVTQVLTGYLTKGAAYDCVQAMECFNSEGSTMGAKAICYLSYDSSDAADGGVFKVTGCDPTDKYSGKNKPTKTQLAAGELGSQKRRSNELGFQVKRTQQRK